MKKIFKIFLAGVITIMGITIVGIKPTTLLAKENVTSSQMPRAYIVDSGVCGKNAEWTIDSNSTLRISGTGAIEDYASYTRQPWIDYAEEITSITIDDGITRIGKSAFEFLCNVENVEYGDSLKEIGAYAFSFTFDTARMTFKITENITLIEEGAFSSNAQLNGFEVDKENPKYCSYDGHLLDKDMTILIQAANLQDKEITLPSSVTTIGESAMRGGKYETFINDNIEYVHAKGVVDCYFLETVKLNALKKIDAMGFYWDSELKNVEMNSLEEIGMGAFWRCEKLERLTLPKSLKKIGENAFYNCTSLNEVTFKGDAPVFDGDDIFENVTATVYYSSGNKGWTSQVRQNYAGSLTWKDTISKNVITAKNMSKVVNSSARTIAIGATCKGNTKLTYKSNNKNITVNAKGKVTIKKNYIGRAKITITSAATSKYSKATKTITVTVKPAKATITSLQADKNRKPIVKNKKNIGNVKYQIQFDTKSSLNDPYSAKVSYRKDGYRINKQLKKNKTYYFRIRGYKQVNGTTFYGAWSDVKKLKVK